MEYGIEIAANNNGKPLHWLNENEEVMCNWDNNAEGGPYPVECVHGWTEGFRIRLPIDHFAYKAIAAGFTPWGGSDVPPDADEVMFRDGEIEPNIGWFWGRSGHSKDIIGYRKRVEHDGVHFVRLTSGGDWDGGRVYERVADGDILDNDGDERYFCEEDYRPATPSEIEQYKAGKAADTAPVAQEIVGVEMVSLPIMTPSEADNSGYCVVTLRALGLVFPETTIERFERHHGGLDSNQRDIVEIYQNWLDGQS